MSTSAEDICSDSNYLVSWFVKENENYLWVQGFESGPVSPWTSWDLKSGPPSTTTCFRSISGSQDRLYIDKTDSHITKPSKWSFVCWSLANFLCSYYWVDHSSSDFPFFKKKIFLQLFNKAIISGNHCSGHNYLLLNKPVSCALFFCFKTILNKVGWVKDPPCLLFVIAVFLSQWFLCQM